MLLHDWPAVIATPMIKTKPDLKQAAGSGNTLSAIALNTKHLQVTGILPAELLMKMWLRVFFEFVYPAVQVCMTVTGFMKFQKYQSQLLRKELSP